MLAFAAPVAAAPVLLTRVQASGVDSAVSARVDATLRAEARAVLGEELSPLAPERPEACAKDEACAAALATQHSVPLVLLTSYAVTGSSHQLRVRLHDVNGNRVGIAERSLPGEPDAAVLRGALYQLLNPAEYVGRLRFENAPPDVQVSVDRLALAAADLRQPYRVSVGKHVVAVSAPGYASSEREIDVAYDELLTVDAALTPLLGDAEPRAPVSTSPVPWWPAAVAGGIAGAAALTAIIAGLDGAVTAQTAAATSRNLGNDGTFEDHHYAASLLPAALEREKLVELRAAARTDAIIVASAGAIAVIAGAAAAGFAARWALAEDEAAP